jgi:hypothetical protein
MRIQSENIAFDSEDLIECGKCGKPNPPNRGSCLYCAVPLAIPDERAGLLNLNLRPLENWENGFNIVYMPPYERADKAAIGRYLKLEPEQAARMLNAKAPFPLARIESGTEAETASKHLGTLGVKTRVVNDIDVKIGRPHHRLRAVEFDGDALHLTLFNTGERRAVKCTDIMLIVIGRMIDSTIESVEKRKRAERKVLSETAMSSDDLLIDLYAAGEETGFRISTRGFDFSTLGREKSLLAAENVELLLNKIRNAATAARFVDDYPNVMSSLSLVWDIERRTDFEGLKRTGVLRSGFANVMRTSNLEQFTKYSRLQRLLI